MSATRTKRTTRRPFAGLRLAAGLLTVIPVGGCSEAEGLGAAAAWFPLVGAAIGLALVLWALLLVATLASLPRDRALSALVIACALGRWAAVVHAAALRPARRDGLGAAFNPQRRAVIVATVLAAATAALQPLPTLAALVGATAVAAATSVVASRSLGGRTGDTLGATVALTEAVACIVLVGFAR